MSIWTVKSSPRGAVCEIRRTTALLVLLFFLPKYAVAMRVSPINEYATLVHEGVARLGQQHCIAPAGSTVRIMGRTTNLDHPVPEVWLFVRLVTGEPCAGHELTIAEAGLRDFRATPAASTK